MGVMARLAGGLVLSAGLAAGAMAAPCAGFTDVDDTSAFCPNVAWLKNRSITLGCRTGFYCPNESVTRLQMAAFMNRLGTALMGQELRVETTVGAVALDTAPVVCLTTTYAVNDFPRRARLDLAFAGQAAGDVDFAADLVMTPDGGTTWVILTALPSRGSAAAGRWGNVANLAVRDLDAGQSVRFGVRMSRVSGTADLVSARCNLSVRIGSRNGTIPPF